MDVLARDGVHERGNVRWFARTTEIDGNEGVVTCGFAVLELVFLVDG